MNIEDFIHKGWCLQDLELELSFWIGGVYFLENGELDPDGLEFTEEDYRGFNLENCKERVESWEKRIKELKEAYNISYPNIDYEDGTWV